jgi:DNA repair exonuclease SbcCD ATPase subunit
VLSGSLDSDGIDVFLNILKKFNSNENIFVITHDEKFIDRVDNFIQFKKIKGFSKVI